MSEEAEKQEPESGFFSREAMKAHSDFHPQQRPWVGLTDEEMLECNMDGDIMIDRETAKRNVEAKLKEKNYD
jgi:hypothetical protein